MTSDLVARLDDFEFGTVFKADRHRLGAACAEEAAFGWIEGAGSIAGEKHACAFALEDGVGDGNSREKRLRVGMEGMRIEFFGGCDFDDVAEVHDGDAVRYVFHHAKIMGDK